MKALANTAKQLLETLSSIRVNGLWPANLADCSALIMRAETTIKESERVIAAGTQTLSFKEFLDSPLSVGVVWCRLSITRTKIKEGDASYESFGVVLQWDPSGYKWYLPKPFEGREECGHLTQIGPIRDYGDIGGEIESLQVVIPDVTIH